MNYLDLLNPQQRAAVECTDGPVIIIAGATGKNPCTCPTIYAFNAAGRESINILALTFTNKAARECGNAWERRVIGAEARNLWMGTFHSVFAKILRVEAERFVILRISPFTIPTTPKA
jgi:DNA helicase-2/ATP-dependent DNA helicase PcrA